MNRVRNNIRQTCFWNIIHFWTRNILCFYNTLLYKRGIQCHCLTDQIFIHMFSRLNNETLICISEGSIRINSIELHFLASCTLHRFFLHQGRKFPCTSVWRVCMQATQNTHRILSLYWFYFKNYLLGTNRKEDRSNAC